MTDPEHRITLITGGNKGLGHEAARRLSAQGHRVCIGARDEERGREAAEELDVAGIVRVTHAFLPLLRRSGAPVIVNVSSGMGSFARTEDPERVESSVGMPIYSASKAAVSMLTKEYAKLLPEMRVNAADPGYTATDFNGGSGSQTIGEGTDAIVALATLAADGPSGTFVDRDGTVPW